MLISRSSKHRIYQEVANTVYPTISIFWVSKTKITGGKKSVKRRLCPRGFEEANKFETDSPTCSRESFRIGISLITSNE